MSTPTPAPTFAPTDIHRYFVYNPNQGAAIFFTIFFGIATIIIAYQAQRKKQYWLHWLTLFAASEAGGYLTRELIIVNTNDATFIATLIILILAPNLVALVNYVAIGKIIPYADLPKSSKLRKHPTWIPYLFLASDLLCLTLQAIGGGILANQNNSAAANNLGKAITLAGLGAQLGFVFIFLGISVYVYRITSEVKRLALLDAYICLFVTMSALVVRNIYRVAEFGEGSFTSGYLSQNEAWYMMFDPFLMSVAVITFIALDYARVLPEECLFPNKNKDDTIVIGVVDDSISKSGQENSELENVTVT